MIWQPQLLVGGGGRCDPACKRDNWNKDLPSEGMKAKSNRKWHVFFLAWTAETHSTIKVLFILYFVSHPESESESEWESESIRSTESQSESEQPHHDSAPLHFTIKDNLIQRRQCRKKFRHATPIFEK